MRVWHRFHIVVRERVSTRVMAGVRCHRQEEEGESVSSSR